MDRKRLFNIFLIVFIDLLGFGIILPLLPFYAEEFGASPATIGLLVAVYPAMQMIGAPILGRLSDRYGRRPVLLVSILGSAIGYLMLGFADSLLLIFLSRVVDGLTGGNISVAQAYITDITDEKNRARGLGLIGAAFGLGFIFGPAVGGALSAYGFAAPAFAAAGLAFINWLGVLLWLPESLPVGARIERAAQPGRASFNLASLRKSLRRPRVGPLYTVRLGVGLAFNTFQTIFPLYALTRLGLNAQETGFVLAYVGVLVVLVQGVIIGPLTRRYRERILIIFSIVLSFAGLLGWALSASVLALLVVMVPIAFGAGIFNTVINSAISKAVYPEEVGGALGLSSSLDSLTRVISPAASGFLLGRFGASVPGIVGAAILLLLLPYAWQRLIANPDPPLPSRDQLQNVEEVVP
jgi:DHA1 family tetracycline resistance protein-like MFS transporter